MPPKRKSTVNKENVSMGSAKKVKTSKADEEDDEEMFLESTNPTTSLAASSNITPQKLGDLSNKFETAAKKTPSRSSKRDANEANKDHKEKENNFTSLVEKLKSAKKSGDFSVEGEAHELPKLLKLYVKDFGSISLPLEKLQADELIKKCKPAPYGKNMDTLVDKNVRDSYQLDPDQIEIRNRDWNTKLQELVDRVGKTLGCQAKIEAKLYKVLIYKPGGHFVKHRDTEKDKKMFGTLIIQPPSTHTGGELVVYEANGKSKKVIDFGQKENKSKFSIQFAAHYADLEHELLEVKSGYRLALVYSLCWIRGNGHSTYHMNSSLAYDLSAILDKLNDHPYQLGLLMEHQYTPQSFQTNGFQALKGKDNDFYNLLHHANQLLPAEKQLSMYICHASLFIERYDVSGYDHPAGYIDPKYKHYEWDESDRDYKIGEWYDINGKPIFTSSHFELDFFTKMFDMSSSQPCQVDLKNESEWGKYTHQAIGGYLGNESVTQTTTYSKYMLAIWPKRFEFEILLRIDVNLVVDSIYRSVVTNSSVDSLIMEQFQSVLKLVPKKQQQQVQKGNNNSTEKQTKTINGKAINEILEILLKLNDMKYVEEFLSQHKPLITPKNSHLFVELIVQFGYESIKHLLKVIVNPKVEDLIQNCHFIMALHEEKKTRSLALDYMMSCVISLINKPSELKKIIEYTRGDMYGGIHSWRKDHTWRKNPDDERDDKECDLNDLKKRRHVLVTMAKTLHTFHEQSAIAHAFETLVDGVLKSADSKDHDDRLDILFYDLAEEFQKEKNALKKCAHVNSLFERRKKWLKEKIRQKPAFSWNMPNAKLPQHPRVEEFLKGEEAKMTYSFKNVHDLRNFINSYGDSWGWNYCCRDFSVKITEKPGKTVLITKTKKVYEDMVKKYDSYEKELAKINAYLGSK